MLHTYFIPQENTCEVGSTTIQMLDRHDVVAVVIYRTTKRFALRLVELLAVVSREFEMKMLRSKCHHLGVLLTRI